MGSSDRFPTHHVPDDGTRYAPGEIVHIDHSSGRIRVIKDPAGEYEILNCRQATEYGSATPLLRLGLRRLESSPVNTSAPLPMRRLYRR
jgi:hypothetical protein